MGEIGQIVNPVQEAPPASSGAAPTAREFAPSRVPTDINRLRLQTSTRLRWLAVAGQLLAVFGVYFGFGFPMHFTAALVVIAISAGLNIFLSLRFPAQLRLRNRYAAALLAYDIIQLAVLLWLTGGLKNPFSLLFLVPTAVSAAMLPPKWTIWLAGLTLACISLIAVNHQPLPWAAGETFDLAPVYVLGIWAALICGLGFTGIYTWRIAEESRRMSQALSETELVLAHEQQLSALDGLAAAAAHELGTPLATIALVAKELRRDWPDADNVGEDLDLLRSQAERCRTILSSLTARGQADDEVLKRAPLQAVLAEIADIHRHPVKPITMVVDKAAEGAEPVIDRNPALLYGIGNLVTNALDFARNEVILTASWSNDQVVVSVTDDGPGFSADILNKLGEPYVTTRKRGDITTRAAGRAHDGMGLGFFIAKTLLERSGAAISVGNRAGARGAEIILRWPRDGFDNG